jgi:hypothetical protein
LFVKIKAIILPSLGKDLENLHADWDKILKENYTNVAELVTYCTGTAL